MMKEGCHLCPRACGADRKEGQTGFCKMTGNGIRAARAALHFWEEPCISGSRGSGTVFFSGCTLRCVYCQNSRIAQENSGIEISRGRLVEIFFELKEKGAHNINLVTPSHYADQLAEAMAAAKQQDLNLPFVYNCGGYEKTETLRMLDGLVDVYLTDFKYISEESAARYSHAADYPRVAAAALAEMVRQQPDAVFSQEGLMQRGVIVRHLLLPGHRLDAQRIVSYLHETYGSHIWLSLMSQYTPPQDFAGYPEINRKVTRREYERLVDFTVSLGVEQAYVQEMTSADSCYVPAFDGEGIRAD